MTDEFTDLRDPKRPGSDSARERGCICPSNRMGLGDETGRFEIDDTCPQHWEMAYHGD